MGNFPEFKELQNKFKALQMNRQANERLIVRLANKKSIVLLLMEWK